MKQPAVFTVALAAILMSVLVPGVSRAAKHQEHTPAEDAQYTILCQTFAGPGHAHQAREAKEGLLKVTGSRLPDWFVVTSEEESNLYYGYYRSYDDPKDKDTARAQEDKKLLATLTDTNGSRPFQSSIFVPMAGNDPPAPPEWNLKNAKGYFSLQIATYMDSPLRKQAAVDAVRDARAQGIEAYYFHGPTASHVCIGAWPRDAVRQQEADQGTSDTPDQPILVSTTPLPSRMKDLRTKDTGQKVKVLNPSYQPLDPSLKAMQAKFPLHSINGETVPRKYSKDGKEVTIEDPSFLVLIPQKEEAVRQDPVLAEKAKELGIDQTAQPKRGTGTLKSIGE